MEKITKKPLPRFPYLISHYPVTFVTSQLVAACVTMVAYNYIDNQIIGMFVSLVSSFGFLAVWYRDSISRHIKGEEPPQEESEDF